MIDGALLINILSGEGGDHEMAWVDHSEFAWIFGVPTSQSPGCWRLASTRRGESSLALPLDLPLAWVYFGLVGSGGFQG
jgi:hypothetical protein